MISIPSEFDATDLCGGESGLGALADHLALVLGDGGKDVHRLARAGT
jgi:hypothetical protein